LRSATKTATENTIVDYWFYNTDAKAFGGETAAERLFKRGYAVTGGPEKFGALLGKLTPGDTVLMYENLVGILGVGTVLKNWDGISHRDSWYYGPDEPHEFRIRVDWYLDFTEKPIDYNTLRDAIGYVPRGALKRDIHKHDAIEELIADHIADSKLPKKRNTKPTREECVILRIVRDTGIARTVKQLHEFRCQICGERIELPDGRYYAEAHHIRPLGKPHNGDDVIENVICVCPNHHAELDYLATRLERKKLGLIPTHDVDTAAIEHHNKRCDTAGVPE